MLFLARRDRYARRDRRGDDRMIDTGRQRGDHHVDAARDRIAGREVDGLRVGAERVRHLGELVVVAIGEQHPVDAGRVDELARGAGTDRADADDERGRHGHRSAFTEIRDLRARANRRWWAARRPCPRTRASIPTAPAAPSTRSRRLKTFTTRECIEHAARRDSGAPNGPPAPLLRCFACPGAIAQSVRAHP